MLSCEDVLALRAPSLTSWTVCVLQGITYDHVELNLYLNGKNMHCPASGIRGTVYPVVYGNPTFHTLTHFIWFICRTLSIWLRVGCLRLNCDLSDVRRRSEQIITNILFQMSIAWLVGLWRMRFSIEPTRGLCSHMAPPPPPPTKFWFQFWSPMRPERSDDYYDLTGHEMMCCFIWIKLRW